MTVSQLVNTGQSHHSVDIYINGHYYKSYANQIEIKDNGLKVYEWKMEDSKLTIYTFQEVV